MMTLTLPAKQQGYILLMTLVMMVMLTGLAVTQVASNSNLVRLAGNATDSQITFAKAEGALVGASTKLIKGVYSAAKFVTNGSGLYVYNPATASLWKTVDWNSSAVISSFNGDTSTPAAYIIEQLPSAIKPGQNMKRPTRIYRVTAQATRANGNSTVRLQSTVTIQQ